jgi:hypothetical protein
MYLVNAELATLDDPRFVVRFTFECNIRTEDMLRCYMHDTIGFAKLVSFTSNSHDVVVTLVDSTDRDSIVFSGSCNRIVCLNLVTPDMYRSMMRLNVTFQYCQRLAHNCFMDMVAHSGLNHHLENYIFHPIDEFSNGDLSLDLMSR